jgi:5-formyltetrahydrofolate cyclo-ligase
LNDKQLLRAKFRKLRREHVAALPDATRGLLFLRPPGPVASLASEGAIVGLYHAHGDEAPTHAYARWFYENEHRIALPWFAGRGEAMQFREWRDPWNDGTLQAGPYRALQPGKDAALLTPATVFVPLLGFTADGARLGQGGGHYDRWLAENPSATAVGLAWDCQLAGQLPLEDHDRLLHAVVTPTRIYQGAA